MLHQHFHYDFAVYFYFSNTLWNRFSV